MSAARSPVILTSFAYGTGPYLRTTEWALAVADLLGQLGKSRNRIVVPLVYGNKQRLIMEEALGTRMHDVILDKAYGKLLAPLFYGQESYATYLERWVESVDGQSKEIQKYLKNTYGDNIVLELHRSPRVSIGLAPSFALTFGWQSDILTQAKDNPEIDIPEEVLNRAIPKFQSIEQSFKKCFLTDPGTFSFTGDVESCIQNTEWVPPTIAQPSPSRQPIALGIYVTVTGIPGLERLFTDAKKLGMTIYSNNPGALREAEKALPDVIGNPAIKLHFARSGWSSVWLSLLTETPFIAAPWDPKDDPEIYFNNQCIESLGIGTVYRGQSLEELLKEGERQKTKMKTLRTDLMKKYGTLDGTVLSAKKVEECFSRS